MPPLDTLAGAIAVVTRAASPIGFACAQRLAADGAIVVMADAGAVSVADLPPGAVAVDSDVSDAASMNALVELCERRWGRVDALVNCHARTGPSRLEEVSDAVWADAWRENVMGPLAATLALLPLLKRAGSSAVVHLGSIDGSLGNPSYAAYSVTKGSMTAMTHLMAHDFAPYGIRVNLIARAAVDAVAVDWSEAPWSDLLAVTPLGRPAHPGEIADAVAFLVSPASSYITGTVLTVDGGRTAITPGTGRR